MAPINPSAASNTEMMLKKRQQPSIFHKPQKRGPLAPTTANKSDNKVGKDYDLVKPEFKYYSATAAFKVGGATRNVKKTVRAPAQLMVPRPEDKDAKHKALNDLMAREKADKQAKEEEMREEVDSLFGTDDEDSASSTNHDDDSLFGSNGEDATATSIESDNLVMNGDENVEAVASNEMKARGVGHLAAVERKVLD